MRRRPCRLPVLALALLGLALPAEAAQPRPPAHPPMGWLGISIADVGEELAERLATTFGPAAGNGVQVVEVLKGGPAERAPLRSGDVIVRLGAQPIWDVRQLQQAVRSQPVNRQVVLTILREADRITVPVTIGAMPLQARAQVAAERFGFLVREEAEQEGPARIAVSLVGPASPAARAGLQPRDLIRTVNDRPILDLEDFERAVRRSEGEIALVVERRGVPAPLSLTLELPRR